VISLCELLPLNYIAHVKFHRQRTEMHINLCITLFKLNALSKFLLVLVIIYCDDESYALCIFLHIFFSHLLG